jgi:hypothetical protein
MVKEEIKENKKYFICDECGFAYKEKDLAQKCEDWCNKYHSCNVEITKNAVTLE